MSPFVLSVLGAIVLLFVLLALSALRVVQQYERGVIFVLGRLSGAKGPGLFLVPPLISRMSTVDLRIVTLTVPPQDDLCVVLVRSGKVVSVLALGAVVQGPTTFSQRIAICSMIARRIIDLLLAMFANEE